MGRIVKQLPPSGTGRYDRPADKAHLKIVRSLQRKPYQWMEVKKCSSPQMASRWARKVRESEFVAFRDGQYEATSKAGVVYVRYMGERV